jgi:hypothetical protein
MANERRGAFRFYPDRDRLLAEAHARPSTPLPSPTLATRIAALSGDGGPERDRAHMVLLCRRLGAPEPGPGARWSVLDAGSWRLRWERHTEISNWTFYRAIAEDTVPPPEESALDLVPQDWLAELPGDVLVAAHIVLLRQPPEGTFVASDEEIASSVADGAAQIFTDFRAGPDAFTRIRIINPVAEAALARNRHALPKPLFSSPDWKHRRPSARCRSARRGASTQIAHCSIGSQTLPARHKLCPAIRASASRQRVPITVWFRNGSSNCARNVSRDGRPSANSWSAGWLQPCAHVLPFPNGCRTQMNTFREHRNCSTRVWTSLPRSRTPISLPRWIGARGCNCAFNRRWKDSRLRRFPITRWGLPVTSSKQSPKFFPDLIRRSPRASPLHSSSVSSGGHSCGCARG